MASKRRGEWITACLAAFRGPIWARNDQNERHSGQTLGSEGLCGALISAVPTTAAFAACRTPHRGLD